MDKIGRGEQGIGFHILVLELYKVLTTGKQMHSDVSEILFSKDRISQRVNELGKEMSEIYDGKNPLMLGILNGAVVFFSDLIRAMDIQLQADFMAISSYGASSKSTGVVRILKDLNKSIENRHIVIVEDIIDSGLTLSYLQGNLVSRGASSISICVLLDKPDRRKSDITPDFIGFTVPDEFLVGYGLDYAESYRNLPYIGILKREIYAK